MLPVYRFLCAIVVALHLHGAIAIDDDVTTGATIDAVAVTSENCAATTCTITPKVYAELHCVPIIADGECCATRYECPPIVDLDPAKCHLNGKSYNVSEQIGDNDGDKPPCALGCICTRRNDEEAAQFTCAAVDCPPFFKKDCVIQRPLDQCCPAKEICDTAEIEKLATCHFEGKTFSEGETMYPDSVSCHHCVCTKDFNNATAVTVNPNCRSVNCGVQLRKLTQLRNGCIPIYFKDHSCCPIDWRCPEKSDKLEPSGSRTSAGVIDPKMTCKFGALTMSVGDSVATDNKCEKCTCHTPPMAQCVKEPDCF